ncbi:hypothetical protein H8959_003150 [Pygathrix nigripes]
MRPRMEAPKHQIPGLLLNYCSPVPVKVPLFWWFYIAQRNISAQPGGGKEKNGRPLSYYIHGRELITSLSLTSHRPAPSCMMSSSVKETRNLVLLVRILCSTQQMPFTKLYVTILLTAMVFLLRGLLFCNHWFLVYGVQNYSTILDYLKRTGIILSSINLPRSHINFFFAGSFRQRQWQ